jgi:uncharacterized protein YgiM (DUF1202 family)
MSQIEVIDPDPPGAPAATVKADAVCRSGPTSDYEVQDTLTAGEILSIQGRSPDGNAWVVFSTDLGDTCWVEGAFVDVAGAMSPVEIVDPDPPHSPSATVKAGTVCRSGPTADYEVRDTLKAGEVLTVQGRNRSGDAWMVFNPDLQGNCWVGSAFVDVVGEMSQVEVIDPIPPGAPPQVAPTQGAATATVKENSVCRSGPTKEYKILAYFNAGTVLNIVGRNRAGNSWVVENPVNRRNCWIFGGLVDVIGDTGLVMIVNPDPPPTPTQKPEIQPFSCSQITDKNTCDGHTGCKWNDNLSKCLKYPP